MASFPNGKLLGFLCSAKMATGIGPVGMNVLLLECSAALLTEAFDSLLNTSLCNHSILEYLGAVIVIIRPP